MHLQVRGQLLDRCESCGFVQVRYPPSDEELEEIYKPAYFIGSKYRDLGALRLEIERRLSMLDRVLPQGASILDAGCSTGDFVTAAKQRYTVFGSDLSAFAIERAKAANPDIADRLIAGKLEDSPHGETKFDAICLWDVLEHIWNPVEVCADLMNRLKPGGYLFLSTPAIDAPAARFFGRYWAFMTPPEHLGFFTKATFARLFGTILPGSIEAYSRRGKWANIAFIAHKIRRIAPTWLPTAMLAPLELPRIGRIAVYVPTGDVQYLTVRKSEGA